MSIATETSAADTISLNQLRIASPCTADWDAMSGDDRTRFCGECQLNVYNISAMTEPEARDLIASTEGRLCVRMYRRADGTILTQDCPVGLAKLRKRARMAWMKVAAVFAMVCGGIALGRVGGESDSNFASGRDSITDLPGIRQVVQFFRPRQRQMIMGDICVTPAPAVQTPPPAHAIMGEVEAIPQDYTSEMGGARIPPQWQEMPAGGDCGMTPSQVPTRIADGT